MDVSGLYKGLWGGRDVEGSFEGFFFFVCLLFLFCVFVLFSPFFFGSGIKLGL